MTTIMSKYARLDMLLASALLLGALATPCYTFSMVPPHCILRKGKYVPGKWRPERTTRESLSSIIGPTRYSLRPLSRDISLSLPMGIMDNINSFLGNRERDFVKLESTNDAFGPGPAVLLYGCPGGISDDEIMYMISDGAPKAYESSGGVSCKRIGEEEIGSCQYLDQTVSDALQLIVEECTKQDKARTRLPLRIVDESISMKQLTCPVIYFSGFSNSEMMQTYQIIAKEIFDETGGVAKAACAKAVPPAMGKTLREVIEDITGDHLDAISATDGE